MIAGNIMTAKSMAAKIMKSFCLTMVFEVIIMVLVFNRLAAENQNLTSQMKPGEVAEINGFYFMAFGDGEIQKFRRYIRDGEMRFGQIVYPHTVDILAKRYQKNHHIIIFHKEI